MKPLKMNSPSPILLEYQARLKARTSFREWCVLNNCIPAKHHEIIIAKLQVITDRIIAALNAQADAIKRGDPSINETSIPGLKLMILCPPGSAKSTYTSKLFVPWFLAQAKRVTVPEFGILACSHEADLATEFGAAARNYAESNERWLGYTVKRDTRAADHWATNQGGQYKASSVGSGIAGRRMHLGLIDDFCGKYTDVASKLFNNGVWNWYINDFKVRLQPIAARVIIANHRNQDDLVGRLLEKESGQWEVIRLRLLIENEEQATDDPLERKVGDYLWPEYFTRQQVNERMANPDASGIEQQNPMPAEGNMFKAEWFKEYEVRELDDIVRHGTPYGASDHAVREKEHNDCTCMGLGFWYEGLLYIHPKLEWDRFNTLVAVDKMMWFNSTFHPVQWWAEKENISGSIGPFLSKRMQEDHCYMAINEVSHMNKDLTARCQSILGLMQQGRVRFPSWAPWFSRFKAEVMTFPNAKHDDSVSFLAHLGRGVAGMYSNSKPQPPAKEVIQRPFVPTLRWLRESCKAKDRLRIARMEDN
jgi:hypothetical protein